MLLRTQWEEMLTPNAVDTEGDKHSGDTVVSLKVSDAYTEPATGWSVDDQTLLTRLGDEASDDTEECWQTPSVFAGRPWMAARV